MQAPEPLSGTGHGGTTVPSPTGLDAIPLTEGAGEVIGRYKLLEILGEGGFGVVWLAEQREPVRRQVALKIIKLGMDTRQVVARFEAERQALALMDHPHIAKVLDGGSTDGGRPYFVMELVRGIRITDYCDQNKLPTAQRLELFISVCQAIQHAHQKGIIHRDIKPSNILVTMQDGVGMPKVIDFGIAKATQQELTNTTLHTQLQQFVGTPAYMSPEQAEMSALDIDTRSDIYSLGVLLYELLTGQTPFDAKELMRSGIEEMRRIIREREPARPSTKVASLPPRDQSTTATRQRTDTPKLISLLRGDLDWIVMKCLEKDRTRRYETANGLARDIQRHLRDESVEASPPRVIYRLGKFVRRHKLFFGAGAAVALALVLGLGASTWLFFKERAARRTVATEAVKSQQVAQFLKDMLDGVGPSVAKGRDTTLLKEILDKTAERVGKELTNQPAVQAELQDTVGATYYALGNYELAEGLFRAALANRRRSLGNAHPDIAWSLQNISGVLDAEGRLSDSELVAREALSVERRSPRGETTNLVVYLNGLGLILWREGKLKEAESICREALSTARRVFRSEHMELATSLNALANVLFAQDQFAEAEGLFRDSLAIRTKLAGTEDPAVLESRNNLAWTLKGQGKLAAAEQLCRENLAIARKVLGNQHPDLAVLLNNLAQFLVDQHRPVEAEGLLREALAIVRVPASADPSKELTVLGQLLHHLAEVLRQRKALPEALSLAREAHDMYQRHADWPRAEASHASAVLAAGLADQGNYAEAEPLLVAVCQELTQGQPKSSSQGRTVLIQALERLIQLYDAWGKPDQAAKWREEFQRLQAAGQKAN